MLFKHKENGAVIELENPATYNLAERNGFAEMTEEEIAEYKKPKKQKKEE